jgi:rhamnosyltransferase
VKSKLSEDAKELNDWYQEKGVKAHEYYLAVGRFVPENNFETMVSEFMKSNTKKDFVLITNVENNSFYESLLKSTHFDQDKRIKFVGTVYDKELLKKLRENAYGYFHGHEVGGTNPSLLESLGSTDLNLLLDVGFNREVGEDGALYWSKEDGALASLIHKADAMTAEEISAMGIKAKERITKEYSWDYIVDCYEKVFLGK